jgi:hypothetical protein
MHSLEIICLGKMEGDIPVKIIINILEAIDQIFIPKYAFLAVPALNFDQ